MLVRKYYKLTCCLLQVRFQGPARHPSSYLRGSLITKHKSIIQQQCSLCTHEQTKRDRRRNGGRADKTTDKRKTPRPRKSTDRLIPAASTASAGFLTCDSEAACSMTSVQQSKEARASTKSSRNPLWWHSARSLVQSIIAAHSDIRTYYACLQDGGGSC
jgi:hypothetical protein